LRKVLKGERKTREDFFQIRWGSLGVDIASEGACASREGGRGERKGEETERKREEGKKGRGKRKRGRGRKGRRGIDRQLRRFSLTKASPRRSALCCLCRRHSSDEYWGAEEPSSLCFSQC